MILFIFEGNKREPQLFSSMQKLFFPKGNEAIICSFGNNIYELYRKMQEMDGVGDVVSILREKSKDKEDNPFKDVVSSSDFSEIYLFFDYDFHNRNYTLEELNVRITSMLLFLTMRRKMGNFISTIPWWNLSVIPSCCLTASIGVIRYPVILVHLSKKYRILFRITRALTLSAFHRGVNRQKANF